MAITHTYVSTVPDDGSDRVGSNEWNADHTIADATLTKAKLDATAQQFMVPAGGIIIWSGAAAAIPTGWVLCDGTNSTPDLRNKFVAGASAAGGGYYAVGATGGAGTHTHDAHTVTQPTASAEASHTHAVSATTSAGNEAVPRDTWGGANNAQSANHVHTISVTSAAGSSHTHTITGADVSAHVASNHMPPYYALCYIMKTA